MIGITALFNMAIAGSGAITTAASTGASMTRLQVWTNTGPTVSLVVLGVVAVCAIAFVARHTVAWQRAIAKGEDFVLHNQHHMLLDLVLVSVVLAGVVATRLV